MSDNAASKASAKQPPLPHRTQTTRSSEETLNNLHQTHHRMNPNKKNKGKSLSAPFKKLFRKIGSRSTSPVPDERSDDNFSTKLSPSSTLVATASPVVAAASTPMLTDVAGDEGVKIAGVLDAGLSGTAGEIGPSLGRVSPDPVITIEEAQDAPAGGPENRDDRAEGIAKEGVGASSTKEGSKGKRVAALAYEGFKESLRAVVRCSDAFPPLKTATQSVLEIFERYDAVTGMPNELTDLKDKLMALVSILQANDVLAIRDRLSGLARTFEEKTKVINAKLERNIASRIIESTDDVAFISRELRSVTFAVEIVMMDVNLRTHSMVSDLHHIALLDKLKYVEGAGFDHEDRQGCANGTRMLLLADLLTWATELKSEHVFWLNGMAGTGKTAVAETLCNLLAGKNLLGSSFFCSRKTADRRKVHLIFPSLASALAYKYPEFREELVRVLQNCLDPTGMDLEKQFKTLLMEPARIAFARHSGPVVLAVDALDECEDQQAAENLLKIILKERAPGALRFFVTSRPETKIRKGFSTGGHAGVRLQDIETHIVKADIHIYLLSALEEIDDLKSEYEGPWPPAELETIVENSGNLFIYAATAVKYISDERGDPIERLRKYASITPPPNAVEAIDEVYLFVLRDTFHQLDAEEQRRVQLCLQTVVCALEPLSVAMYGILLGMSVLQVRRAFASLHSVVQMPEDKKNDLKIILYHASFPDYLTSASRTNSAQWFVDISVAHGMLLDQCLKVMMSKLHFNVVNAPSSYTVNKLMKLDVEPALEYTCNSWPTHLFLTVLESSLIPDSVALQIEQFFLNKFLYWLEVLSITETIQYTSASLSHIYRLTDSASLKKICWEFATFVSKHLISIKMSAPHIYVSALPWVAPNSILGKQFLPKFSKLPKIIDSKEPDTWVPLVIQLHGHTCQVNSVAYSPNGKYLASGSDDSTIRVWNVETSQQTLVIKTRSLTAFSDLALMPNSDCIVSGSSNCIVQFWQVDTGLEAFHPLEGHSDSVSAVAISPNGKYIASGSRDKSVRLWDGKTRALVFQAEHLIDVSCVRFSPDSTYLASASCDGTIKIWCTESLKESKTLEGHTQKVTCLLYLPDGKTLASCSEDNTIRLWNIETGKQISKPIRAHKEYTNAICCPPDGKFIVSGGDDSTIRFWNVETRRPMMAPLTEHYDEVTCIVYSHSGALFASGSLDKRIILWNVKGTKMTIKFIFDGHCARVTSLIFSKDDAYLFSSSADSTIRKWNVATGQEENFSLQSNFLPFTEHSPSCSVLSVVYSPDGQALIAGLADNTVRIFNASTGEPKLHPLVGHVSDVVAVAISPCGNYIASGSMDQSVRLWNAQTGKQIHQAFKEHQEQISSVAFSHDSSILASSDLNCCIKVWNVSTGQLVATMHKPEKDNLAFTSIAFTASGQSILCATATKDLKIWNLESKLEEKAFSGHTSSVNSAAFAPNYSYIVSGSDDRTVRVWSAETAKEVVPVLDGHSDDVLSVAFAPDGQSVASGSADHMVHIWYIAEALENPIQPDLSSNTILPKSHTDYVLSVAFSPDGKFIASASQDCAIGIWHTDTGIAKYPLLQQHNRTVHTVAWSPDSTLIASGSKDKTIILWNADTGTINAILTGHSGYVLSVAFSPDGKYLASCSQDRTVRIWSLDTKRQAMKPLQGHSASVNSVAYSSDGNFIVSASDDKTLRVWNAQTGARVSKALRVKDIPNSAVFTPNGRYIISGNNDGCVYVWDVHAGFERVHILNGHSNEVTSVVATPNCKYAVSGSRDTHIYIWDLETGECTEYSLDGHSQDILSIAISSDGKFIASSATDNTIRLWNFPNTYTPSLEESRLFHYLYNQFPSSLFLIPPAEKAFVYTPHTHCIIANRRIKIDLGDIASGIHWAQCGANL